METGIPSNKRNFDRWKDILAKRESVGYSRVNNVKQEDRSENQNSDVNLPTKKLKKPQNVILANGMMAKRKITHITKGLIMEIQGHLENIACLVFDNQEYDMILGLNWLSYHNPSVDWELRTIKFDGYICQHPIVPHQMPIEGETHMAINTLKSIPTPKWTQKENLELPPKTWPYEEYPKLFDMELQRRLPPHRPGYMTLILNLKTT
ncbi:hypothetical protein SeLEV6574_g07340 [Synchytrium endobioticum]|uniref:Uncharacterized protein n=1 Tax=Synchytrium endobioticum TaxID=286115 RepID=A0A507CCM0_9FUNG|nr:hypothetical protein SeLEV6574_g07340 [Synchytrium endobioticum]